MEDVMLLWSALAQDQSFVPEELTA